MIDLSRRVSKTERHLSQVYRDSLKTDWSNLEFVRTVAKNFMLSNANCVNYQFNDYAVKKVAWIIKQSNGEFIISYKEIPGAIEVIQVKI